MKKRSTPWIWSDDEDADSGSDSSTVDAETEDNRGKSTTKCKDSSKTKTSQAKKKRELDFEALARHGYKGGPSVLSVPPPKEADEEKQNWSWSKGEENRAKETEETYGDSLKTRAALLEGEQLPNVLTSREKRELSFSQKEKRKRDLGQASRGKSYVEEEKRLLRESGVYSGFDS